MSLQIRSAASPFPVSVGVALLAAGRDERHETATPKSERAGAVFGVRSARLEVAALIAVQAKGGGATTPQAPSEEEQKAIAELKSREQEVRRHEAAHASIGGEFPGAPHYEFSRGPDDKSYAVDGTTPLDVSPIVENSNVMIQKLRSSALQSRSLSLRARTARWPPALQPMKPKRATNSVK